MTTAAALTSRAACSSAACQLHDIRYAHVSGYSTKVAHSPVNCKLICYPAFHCALHRGALGLLTTRFGGGICQPKREEYQRASKSEVLKCHTPCRPLKSVQCSDGVRMTKRSKKAREILTVANRMFAWASILRAMKHILFSPISSFSSPCPSCLPSPSPSFASLLYPFRPFPPLIPATGAWGRYSSPSGSGRILVQFTAQNLQIS